MTGPTYIWDLCREIQVSLMERSPTLMHMEWVSMSIALHSGVTNGAPVVPAFAVVLAGTKHGFCPSPLDAVKFEPTETCPKNFIIFHQEEKKSRIMFHAALADKFNCHSILDFGASHSHADAKATEHIDGGNQVSDGPKEDTQDINALRSSEREDEDEDVGSEGLGCNAPILRVRGRYCNVYTQVRSTFTYIR